MKHKIKDGVGCCTVCGGEHDGACPNCGSAEIQREFHAGDLMTEVFCAKCGFVILG